MRVLSLTGTLLFACTVSFALTRLLHEPGAGAPPALPGSPGVIDILLDGPDLFVDLDVPAATLLGFSRAPLTRAEHDAMVRTHRLLGSGELLRLPAAARCTLTDAYATVGHGYDELCSGAALLDVGAANPGTGARTPAGPIGRARSEASGADARDVSARWSWFCDVPERLERIEVRLFDAFERLERLDASVEMPEGERTIRLSGTRPALLLERTSPAPTRHP